MKKYNLMALDIMPNGKVVPVDPSDFPDFTKPPKGFPVSRRRIWYRFFADYTSQYGMPDDKAWYFATTAAMKNR
jgi:hypothetical protein